MRGVEITVLVPGGELGGWVTGDDTGDAVPVLMLHGGPGLSFGILDGLADELGAGFRVATYQQRGLAPSMTDGPYDVATHLEDVRAVLDALSWDRAYVLGHSWGGHLALHVAVAMPERLSGVLCVDPLGGVDDGGGAAFEAALAARTPPEVWARATADAIPGAWLDVVAGAGHFPWIDRPGCVRAALLRLTRS
jgi:proline iminopeptidase